MLFLLILINCFLLLLKIAATENLPSFCDKNSLPYSIEISETNDFILKCSIPKCSNLAPSPSPSSISSTFQHAIRDDKIKAFGRLSSTSRFPRQSHLVPFNRRLFRFNKLATKHKSNNTKELLIDVTCQNDYISTKCVGDGEWIGGIKVTNNNLNFKCCKSETLKSAKFLSTFDIEKGQLFKGGNVIDIKNNIIAFDYISNIVKVINDGQNINYKIFVNRFLCPSSPKMPFKSPRMIWNTTKLFRSYQAPILEIDNYAGAVSSDAIDGYEGVETTTTMSASDNVDSGYEGDGATTVESVYAPEETIDSYAAPLDSGYSDPATTTTTSSSYGDGYEVDTDSGYATTFEDDFDYNNTDIETDACFINGIPDPPDPADLEDDSARAKLAAQAKEILQHFQESSYSQIPNPQIPNPSIAGNIYQAPMIMSHIPPERPQQIIYQMYQQQQQQQQQFFNNYIPRHFAARNKRQGASGGGGGGGGSQPDQSNEPDDSDNNNGEEEDDGNHSVKLDACPPPPLPSNSNPMPNPVQQPPQPQPPQPQPPQQPPPQQPPVTPPPLPVTPIPPPPPMQCFSGDTFVKLKNGKIKRLDQLLIDDWILSAGNDKMGYNKILSWLHRMPEENADFLKFTLQNGKYLKITKNHFIYKIKCPSANTTRDYSDLKLIEAEKIQHSDCLLSLNDKNTKLIPTKISKIEIIKEKGIYAPLTDNGNIIVNDIFASCYSEIDAGPLHFTLPTMKQNLDSIFEGFRKTAFDSISILNFENQKIDLIPGLYSFVQILKQLF